MEAGIRLVLERRGFRAGRLSVGYQSCDVSTAQEGNTDIFRCFANARAYARTPDVLGVIGPFHSFCSSFEIPITNQATDGPLAMISPSNTYAGLTRTPTGGDPGELVGLYPTGVRNFVRVIAADHLAAVALARGREAAARAERVHRLGRRRFRLRGHRSRHAQSRRGRRAQDRGYGRLEPARRRLRRLRTPHRRRRGGRRRAGRRRAARHRGAAARPASAARRRRAARRQRRVRGLRRDRAGGGPGRGRVVRHQRRAARRAPHARGSARC